MTEQPARTDRPAEDVPVRATVPVSARALHFSGPAVIEDSPVFDSPVPAVAPFRSPEVAADDERQQTPPPVPDPTRVFAS